VHTKDNLFGSSSKIDFLATATHEKFSENQKTGKNSFDYEN